MFAGSPQRFSSPFGGGNNLAWYCEKPSLALHGGVVGWPMGHTWGGGMGHAWWHRGLALGSIARSNEGTPSSPATSPGCHDLGEPTMVSFASSFMVMVRVLSLELYLVLWLAYHVKLVEPLQARLQHHRRQVITGARRL